MTDFLKMTSMMSKVCQEIKVRGEGSGQRKKALQSQKLTR